jgi:hypothetical protein
MWKVYLENYVGQGWLHPVVLRGVLVSDVDLYSSVWEFYTQVILEIQLGLEDRHNLVSESCQGMSPGSLSALSLLQ